MIIIWKIVFALPMIRIKVILLYDMLFVSDNNFCHYLLYMQRTCIDSIIIVLVSCSWLLLFNGFGKKRDCSPQGVKARRKLCQCSSNRKYVVSVYDSRFFS